MKKKWIFIIIILISIFNIYKAIHCYICFNSPTHSIVLSNKNSDIIWVPPAPAGGLEPEIYSPWFQIVLVIQFINIFLQFYLLKYEKTILKNEKKYIMILISVFIIVATFFIPSHR